MSAKVYKFPDIGKPPPPPTNEKKKSPNISIFRKLLYPIWLVLALFWGLVKWVIALDVLYQFLRAIYYSGTPGSMAGWYALFHFVVFVTLTYFVEFYGPRKF
ncbi:protein kleE [Methylomonas sp. Kb3]|nr:protein kleE [Methylomonas sp. Kb3]